MGFNCGIVGLPNVGKSSLFNALTQAEIEIANYPFCTIEPNIGIVAVNDPRLEAISAIVEPQKIIPTTMEFVDIAGLISGASKGEGLGNKFLENIRNTDVIIHVVRCFENDNITHISDNIDPLDDIQTINTELILADLTRVDNAINKNTKLAKSGDKYAKKNIEILTKLQQTLSDGELANSLVFADSGKQLLKELSLLTTKPILFIANVAEDGFTNNKYLDTIIDYAKVNNTEVVTICAYIEAEIAQLSLAEKKEFLQDIGQELSGLDRTILAGYKLLNLQTYFTAGEKEVRAWTINIGDNAPTAAGKIHTDFEKGFIRAQTIAYNDFIKYNGEKGAKDAGKLRTEGKDYIVEDGDILNFLFNV